MNVEPIQDKPQDLSMNKSTIGNSNQLNTTGPKDIQNKKTKSSTTNLNFPTTVKKVKPIPPPLDLAACNLDNSNEAPSDLRTPKSPGDLPRECLPLRKRPLLEGRRDLHSKSPKSAGPQDVARISFSAVDFRSHQPNTAPSSPTVTTHNNFTPPPSQTTAFSLSVPYHNSHHNHHPSSLSLTPSSVSSLSAFSPFSGIPHLQPHHVPPLIPPPGTGSNHAMAAATAMAASAIAAAAAASYSPKSPFAVSQAGTNSGYPTPPTELNSAYPWASPTALSGIFPTPFSPVMPISPLPFTSTAMLSPAPSHPSSTNSSREELPLGATSEDAKRRYLSATINHSAVDSLSPLPSSPLMSPLTRSHNWPVPSWQCFLAGSRIRFLLPNTNTPWQKAEELGWKDKIAAKVDSRNPYQFAPNGLSVLKIDIVTTDTIDAITQSSSSSVSGIEGVGESSKAHTVLLLRMGPHRVDNAPDILADCPIDHPFFVKDKGWSSADTRLTFEKFRIPCRELSVGDVCLPPDHQEAVRTPDLCDRFRRFEFSTGLHDPSSPLSRVAPILPRPVALHHPGIPNSNSTDVISNNILNVGGNKNNQTMSPPISPARKKEKEQGSEKPKRPMNGFMLFAKKYRLELIQQHPGKDNRAISVLLGEAWKSLSLEEREQYSHRAKVMADEQKKIFPDCWKRKRTLTSTSSSAATSSSTSLSSKTTQHHIPTSSLETSSVSTSSLGMPTFSLGNRSTAPSCLTNTLSSTNIIVRNNEDSKAGSDMIQLGSSTNLDITVPK